VIAEVKYGYSGAIWQIARMWDAMCTVELEEIKVM
jgi:hypothetical protein